MVLTKMRCCELTKKVSNTFLKQQMKQNRDQLVGSSDGRKISFFQFLFSPVKRKREGARASVSGQLLQNFFLS